MTEADAFKKAQAALKKYRADRNFEQIDTNAGDGWAWYAFEGPDEDLLREVRRPIVKICINDRGSGGGNTVSKSFRRVSKFPCVNGPLAGKWITHDDSYVMFNSASSGGRWFRKKGEKRITAIFVHLPSIKEP